MNWESLLITHQYHGTTGAEHDHSFAMFGGTQKEKRYPLVTLW
jgi:hypothetical protein